jgi:hypothetical protein
MGREVETEVEGQDRSYGDASPTRSGADRRRRPHVWDYTPPLRCPFSFAHKASKIRPGDIGSCWSRTPMAR